MKQHQDILSNYELCATGTTGTLVEECLCAITTADFMIASSLMSNAYGRQPPNFDSYRQRLKT